jgi:hypothetical protein
VLASAMIAQLRDAQSMSDEQQNGDHIVASYDEFMDRYLLFLDRLKAPEISWEEWAGRYGSLTDEVLDLHSPIVRSVDEHFVWTQCSDSAGGWVVLSGFEMVNRDGYWLSELSWSGDDRLVVRIRDSSEDQEQ